MISTNEMMLKNFITSSWFYLPLIVGHICYGFWNEKKIKSTEGKNLYESTDDTSIPGVKNFTDYYKSQYQNVERKTLRRFKDLSQENTKTFEVENYKKIG